MIVGTLYVRTAAILLLAAAAAAGDTASVLPPAADTAQARVMSALNTAQIPAQTAQLQFLAPLSLNNPAAQFKVTGIEKWQQSSAMLRMRCINSADCVPFFVMLRWPGAQERDAALSAPVLVKARAQTHQAGNVLVRAGDQATLILENKQFRIITPVTCLENGVQGQKIRVRSADRKKIRVAEVKEAGLLKGSL